MATHPQVQAQLPGSPPHIRPLPSISTLVVKEDGPHQGVRDAHAHAEPPRDSGNWSNSQPQSKHSSGVSNIMDLLNAGEAGCRSSVPDTPSSLRHPSYPSNPLPSLNQGFDHHNRLSIDTSSLHDSRRSSVDSRFASGMTHLNLNPTSPYESRNTSHVSLVTDLQRERGITSDQRPNGGLPLSPLGNRAGPRASVQPRRAPVINPNPRSVSGAPDPMAAAPTKGYAWAFPDEMERRGSSSGDSTNNGHYMSRQNSIAATSVNSSIFTTDSNMTNGRKRMREEDVSTTHHHSMQHPAISNLQNADHAAASGGSYSRTPELRYGHKMAERKRRSEMKNLFDELNSILPGGAGTKSSKWEILTKAIDHIKLISNSLRNARDESVRLRPEAEAYRRTLEENQLLRNELATVWHHLRRVDPSSPHVYGSATNMLAQEAQGAGTSSVTTLPPLHPPQQMQQPMPQPPPPPPQPVRHWEQPSSGPMTGVQVQYDGMMPYDHQRR